jgi:hypothetical protein
MSIDRPTTSVSLSCAASGAPSISAPSISPVRSGAMARLAKISVFIINLPLLKTLLWSSRQGIGTGTNSAKTRFCQSFPQRHFDVFSQA